MPLRPEQPADTGVDDCEREITRLPDSLQSILGKREFSSEAAKLPVYECDCYHGGTQHRQDHHAHPRQMLQRQFAERPKKPRSRVTWTSTPTTSFSRCGNPQRKHSGTPKGDSHRVNVLVEHFHARNLKAGSIKGGSPAAADLREERCASNSNPAQRPCQLLLGLT